MWDERRQVLEGLAEAHREVVLELHEIDPTDPWILAALQIAESLERSTRRCGQEGNQESTPDLAWREPFDAFDLLPRDVQDRLILESLGDGAMTTVEVTAAIALRSSHCHPSSSRPFVERLFGAGELEREEGRWGPCRYRYHRRSASFPELGELERMFDEGS